jgi:hypothetical protein
LFIDQILPEDEIAVEYAKVILQLLAHLYEGFGFPVGEAMACAFL